MLLQSWRKHVMLRRLAYDPRVRLVAPSFFAASSSIAFIQKRWLCRRDEDGGDSGGDTATSSRVITTEGCGGGACPPSASAACDMTFCPPERARHCPLSSQHLPQPRGDESLFNNTALLQLHRERPLKCPRAYHALLVDAAGTLIDASESTQEVYHRIGRKYGIKFSEEEIAARYKASYGHPWCRYRIRYEEDGRAFWQKIVEEATGCKDPALLEDLYEYYTTDKAWQLGDPNAERAFKALRAAGIKLAVVSNFDTRLRPLMKVLHCYDWFDAIIVSAEVGVEKPNPEIFWMACKELGVSPAQALHVGDDKTNDIVGASAAGCDSLLWGEEVSSFAEVAKKLGVEVQ